jgi:hypothetical protein
MTSIHLQTCISPKAPCKYHTIAKARVRKDSILLQCCSKWNIVAGAIVHACEVNFVATVDPELAYLDGYST